MRTGSPGRPSTPTASCGFGPCPGSQPERRLEIFDHRKVAHVEGGEIEPFHLRGSRDEVVAEPDPLMRAPVGAHELGGTPGDPLSHRESAHARQQAADMPPFWGSHAAGNLADA